MMSSLTCSSSLAPDDVERFDQPLEVLVRLDVARIEDERIVQLIPFADPHHFVGRRLLVESLVDRVVDDRDLRLGTWKYRRMSRLEASDTVSTRAERCVANHIEVRA